MWRGQAGASVKFTWQQANSPWHLWVQFLPANYGEVRMHGGMDMSGCCSCLCCRARTTDKVACPSSAYETSSEPFPHHLWA